MPFCSLQSLNDLFINGVLDSKASGSVKADISTKDLIKNDGKYKKYKKYVKDGAFRDSYDRSAPAFDLIIDGIEESTYDYLADQNSEAETTEEEEY